MRDSTADPWAWVRNKNAVMWCVTFTQGITPEDVLARYGADPRDAQLLTRQQAGPLYDFEADGPTGSVLRAGMLGDWSFCFEDIGIMGAMDGPLAALSRGTETFSVLRGGDGMNIFAHWRDGRRTEWFEPGFRSTRPRPPHPWWDAVQERYDARSEEYPGLTPVMEAIGRHIGDVLETGTLGGPLLTLLLEDGSRTPDPPQPPPPARNPSAEARRSLGRPLGALITPVDRDTERALAERARATVRVANVVTVHQTYKTDTTED
ncbi:DUF6461 domain-containing protein [Streptomyces hebeiensis]